MAGLESATLRLPVWLYRLAFVPGIVLGAIGLSLVIGAMIGQEFSLLFGAAVLAIPTVLLVRFGLRPWKLKKTQLEGELPEGLSRRQKREEIRRVRLRESRELTVDRYQSRHADLIERLEAVGHRPLVSAVWFDGGGYGGAGWQPLLSCTRCDGKRWALRRSHRLSPNRPCEF